LDLWWSSWRLLPPLQPGAMVPGSWIRVSVPRPSLRLTAAAPGEAPWTGTFSGLSFLYGLQR
jgi:hypothetical protein